MNLSRVAHVRDRLAAARVLQHRGMIDLLRPDEAVRAFLAMRRHGAFGGLLRHTAARYGDAPAITDDRGTLSFRELDQNSNALARAPADKGIRAGAVVASLHRNSWNLMTTAGAANKLGVRLVLMNSGFAGPQLADVAAREQVSCILADDEFRDLLDVLPTDTVRIIGDQHDELIAGQSTSPLPAPSLPGGMVLLTSGTTGTPKGAPRNRIDPLQSAQVLDRIPLTRNGTYCVAAPTTPSVRCCTTCTDPPTWRWPPSPRHTICGRPWARSAGRRSVAHWPCTTRSDAASPSLAGPAPCSCPVV